MIGRKAIFLFSLHGCFCLILLIKEFFSVVMDITRCVGAIREDVIFVCNYAPK